MWSRICPEIWWRLAVGCYIGVCGELCIPWFLPVGGGGDHGGGGAVGFKIWPRQDRTVAYSACTVYPSPPPLPGSVFMIVITDDVVVIILNSTIHYSMGGGGGAIWDINFIIYFWSLSMEQRLHFLNFKLCMLFPSKNRRLKQKVAAILPILCLFFTDNVLFGHCNNYL